MFKEGSIKEIKQQRALGLRRTLCVIFSSLLLQAAYAQDKERILEKAEDIAGFLVLLEHENSIVRQMAIADGLASDERYIRDAAIEAGFASTDERVRGAALAGVLRAKPLFIIEVPVELDARIAAEPLVKWWSNATFTIEAAELFDPDQFTLVARNGNSTRGQNCLIRGDEAICRSSHGINLTLKPGVSGRLTGRVESQEWSLPIVIRNY